MTSGSIRPPSVERFIQALGAETADFYRLAQGVRVSSLGIGTYLGKMDEAADAAYVAAIQAAVRGGINVIDTAINYRHTRSEQNIGAALQALFQQGVEREALLVCTKAGFLTPGVTPSTLKPTDVVEGMHSMAPDFLEDQIDRSRAHLGLETLDVFYLHNPETQLEHLDARQFEDRLRAAFSRLEQLVAQGKLRWFGMATWNGFRQQRGQSGRLDLQKIIEISRQAGGEDPHFRFIQLPLNLAMPEAFTRPQGEIHGQPVSVLEIAARAGITVVASASLMQGRLATGLPEELRAKWPEIPNDGLFALQFTRSTPGVTVALAGMGRLEHVAANLELRRIAPATAERYLDLFSRGQ